MMFSSSTTAMGEGAGAWRVNWVRLFGVILVTLLSGALWWLILGSFR